MTSLSQFIATVAVAVSGEVVPYQHTTVLETCQKNFQSFDEEAALKLLQNVISKAKHDVYGCSRLIHQCQYDYS